MVQDLRRSASLRAAASINPRSLVNLTVLRTSLIVSPIIFLLDVTIGALSGVSAFTPSRLAYVVSIAVPLWQLRRRSPNALWLMYPVAYGLLMLSALDVSTDLDVQSLTPMVTIVVVVVIGLVMAVMGERLWILHVASLGAATLGWSIWIITMRDISLQYAILQSAVGAITFAIGAWLVHWTSTELERRAADARRLALFHEAIATCSEFLHRDGGDAPEAAMSALLQASNATSVFVSRNVDDPVRGPCTSVLFEVYADGVSAADLREWQLVPWEELAHAREALAAGQAAFYRIDETGTSQQARYREYDVIAECNIPIMIDGVWRGVLGFSYSRVEHFHPADVELLETAARILGALWKSTDQRDELERLVASKDELIAAVSHELRTPLTAILGFAEALLELDVADEREFIELIARQSRDMADIIDDLLVSARVEAGTLSIHQQPVSLASVAEEVVVAMRDRFEHHRLRAIETPGSVAAADPVRVRQVVRNLVGNAITHGGEQIEVRTASGDGQATISVWDSGTIEPDDLDRLFERFYTGQAPRPQPGSVGMGLFVSRRLAHLMGGDLTVSSSGSGTEFTLLLPAAATVDAQAR